MGAAQIDRAWLTRLVVVHQPAAMAAKHQAGQHPAAPFANRRGGANPQRLHHLLDLHLLLVTHQPFMRVRMDLLHLAGFVQQAALVAIGIELPAKRAVHAAAGNRWIQQPTPQALQAAKRLPAFLVLIVEGIAQAAAGQEVLHDLPRHRRRLGIQFVVELALGVAVAKRWFARLRLELLAGIHLPVMHPLTDQLRFHLRHAHQQVGVEAPHRRG